MAGERKEVAVEVADIDLHVCHALRAVDDGDSADAVRLLDNLLDVVLEAQDVRDLRHSDNLRLLRDLRLDVFIREIAVFLQIDVLERRTRRLGNELPRHEVAVMLRDRDDNLIAGFDIVQAVAVGDEVQRLRRILGEDNLLGAGRIDELRRARTRILIDLRCLDRERVGATVRISVTAAVVAADGLDDLLRLLRRRAVVEISNLFPVHLHLEKREILQEFLCISHLKVSSANTYRSLP